MIPNFPEGRGPNVPPLESILLTDGLLNNFSFPCNLVVEISVSVDSLKGALSHKAQTLWPAARPMFFESVTFPA